MVVFAIQRHDSAVSVHMFPRILNPLSHLRPHPIPRGCPRAPALGALPHASNLPWSSILHMVIYMFQCYSLILSQPRLHFFFFFLIYLMHTKTKKQEMFLREFDDLPNHTGAVVVGLQWSFSPR